MDLDSGIPWGHTFVREGVVSPDTVRVTPNYGEITACDDKFTYPIFICLAQQVSGGLNSILRRRYKFVAVDALSYTYHKEFRTLLGVWYRESSMNNGIDILNKIRQNKSLYFVDLSTYP